MHSYGLMDLLKDCSFTNATDQRDKIYALLSVASDVHGALAIDYALTGEEVFLRLSTWFVCRGGGLELIEQAAGSPRQN